MLKTKFLILIFLIFFTSTIWWIVLKSDNERNLKVTFLDVGQGDSILIEAPNRNQILIDTGPNKKVLKSLGEVLPIYDKSLDGILLTHPDLDHIGGTIPLFDIFDIEYLFTSSSSKETDVTEEIDKLKKTKKIFLARKDKIIIDPINNVVLEILFPDDSFNTDDANDRSIVAKLTYGETCFLFTGDASRMVELYLTSKYGDYLNCDVLKVGHHGSKTSTSEEFLGFVSPDYGIISAGQENKFGHPDQEVLDILNNFDIEILNTADLGNIIFESDGVNLWRD